MLQARGGLVCVVCLVYMHCVYIMLCGGISGELTKLRVYIIFYNVFFCTIGDCGKVKALSYTSSC